jgi:hypothetical protein
VFVILKELCTAITQGSQWRSANAFLNLPLRTDSELAKIQELAVESRKHVENVCRGVVGQGAA